MINNNVETVVSSVAVAQSAPPTQNQSVSVSGTENVQQNASQTVEPSSLAELDLSFAVSTVRVDLDLDLAIIEFKSSDTGEFLRQYPTEQRVSEYRRAAEIQENRQARAEANPISAAASGVSGGGLTAQGVESQAVTQTLNAQAAQTLQSSNANAALQGAGAGPVNVNAGTASLSDTSSVSNARPVA